MNDLWLDVTLRSLGVAGVATVLVMGLAMPTGYVLSRYEFPGKSLVSALGMLALVLPPTAVGTLLLALLADTGPLGERTLGFDLQILFTWRAAVVASTVMAFPLALRTVRIAFDAVDPKLELMARTLGRSLPRTWLSVTLPQAKRGLVAAAILGYLRALGEYGATAMIAGNISGKTQTLALAIESAQAAGHRTEALGLTILTVSLGLVSLLLAERLLSAPSPTSGMPRTPAVIREP